jgi:hypothetical protein
MNKIVLLLISLFIFTGCFSEEWKGWVYPDRSNLSNSIYIGIYGSLEECRNSAISYIRSNNYQNSGDYECGLNCKNEFGINFCKETSR